MPLLPESPSSGCGIVYPAAKVTKITITRPFFPKIISINHNYAVRNPLICRLRPKNVPFTIRNYAIYATKTCLLQFATMPFTENKLPTAISQPIRKPNSTLPHRQRNTVLIIYKVARQMKC